MISSFSGKLETKLGENMTSNFRINLISQTLSPRDVLQKKMFENFCKIQRKIPLPQLHL